MKIFSNKKNFCKDCQFSFIRNNMLFCAKTINITQPEYTCEIFEQKIIKKNENKNKVS